MSDRSAKSAPTSDATTLSSDGDETGCWRVRDAIRELLGRDCGRVRHTAGSIADGIGAPLDLVRGVLQSMVLSYEVRNREEGKVIIYEDIEAGAYATELLQAFVPFRGPVTLLDITTMAREVPPQDCAQGLELLIQGGWVNRSIVDGQTHYRRRPVIVYE